ncbi:hypothetical protein [Niabella aurantiaca]|uniref:hypothetical protein n=1 Tax=Niabella aurantiaca TaxID=379900 RepID=UPI00037960C4|nr:hypothetical protein [Niabella aurantiaca]
MQITIALNDEEEPSFVLNEPAGQYWDRLDRPIADMEADEGTVYIMEEWEPPGC